jgi:hypothetical protein
VKSVLAVLAGLLTGSGAVAVVESLGRRIYPPPVGVDFSDPGALAAVMAQAPTGALVVILLAWAAGSALGGWLAARLAPRAPRLHALIVGTTLMAAGIVTMLQIPHPAWFWAVSLATVIPASWLGAQWSGRPAAV